MYVYIYFLVICVLGVDGVGGKVAGFTSGHKITVSLQFETFPLYLLSLFSLLSLLFLFGFGSMLPLF